MTTLLLYNHIISSEGHWSDKYIQSSMLSREHQSYYALTLWSSLYALIRFRRLRIIHMYSTLQLMQANVLNQAYAGTGHQTPGLQYGPHTTGQTSSTTAIWQW